MNSTPFTPNLYPPILRGGAYFVDNSSFSYLNRCQRAGLYHLIYRRQLSGSADALNFGGSVHEGLKVRYDLGGMAHETLSTQIDAGIKHLTKFPLTVGDWRNPDYMVEVLRKYALEYPVEDFELLTFNGKRCVELPFAVPLGYIDLPQPTPFLSIEDDGIKLIELSSFPVMWTGRIDLVIQRSGLWIADHKTTSVFGPTYFRQFSLSSQFTGYAFALQQILAQEVKGVMINVLAIRPPTKTGKGIEFARQYLPITQNRIAEWQLNTLIKLSDFFAKLTTGAVIPMNDYACGRNEWQKPCQYLGICDLDPNARDIYLNTGDYKPITWSPLNPDATEEGGV